MGLSGRSWKTHLAQHPNDKMGSFDVVRFDLKMCCVVPSVDSGVIGCKESDGWWCALFVFARVDLFVICVPDLMYCRSHDSCPGRVFSQFLCSGANPNTNGTVKFSLLPFQMQVRQTQVQNLELLDARCGCFWLG